MKIQDFHGIFEKVTSFFTRITNNKGNGSLKLPEIGDGKSLPQKKMNIEGNRAKS